MTDPMTAPAPKPDGVDVDELERLAKAATPHIRSTAFAIARMLCVDGTYSGFAGFERRVAGMIADAIRKETADLTAARDALRDKLAAMVHDRDCWMRKAAEQQTRAMMVQRERDRALATPAAGTGDGGGATPNGEAR